MGSATVFSPEAPDEACTAAVLVDVDPVGMVRGRVAKAAQRNLTETAGEGAVVMPLQFVATTSRGYGPTGLPGSPRNHAVTSANTRA